MRNFDRFWAQLGKPDFTPDMNDSLERRIKQGKTARERYWAWITRFSWGHHEPYCCAAPREHAGAPDPEPLAQSDAAEAIGKSAKTVSVLTSALIKEGLLQADAKGRIVPVVDPDQPVTVDPPAEEESWDADVGRFRADFPLRFKRWEKLRALDVRVHKEFKKADNEVKAYVRHLRRKRARSGNSAVTPVTGPLFDSGNSDDSDSGNDPVSDSGNNSFPTPVTAPEATHTPSLDSHARPTSNIKQEETFPVSESVVESSPPAETAHSLTEIDQAVSEVFGDAPHGGAIPSQLLAQAQSFNLPTPNLCQWIREWGQEKRAANYPLKSRRLIVKAAREGDLALWIRNNANRTKPHLANVASANATPRDSQPREATPEEIAEHKARGTYVESPKRR